MIEQLLNRRFVLEQLDAVRAHLDEPATGLAEADAGDLRRELDAASERERRASSGQRGGLERPAAQRRRGKVPPIDDVAFFSHDPLVSLMQSVLEEYLETVRPDLIEVHDPPPSVRGRRGRRGSRVAVTDRSLRDAFVDPHPDARRYFRGFEAADPRWVASALAMGMRRFTGRHEFNPTPATPCKISNQARLVMVGDWGTGLPRARKVADQMRVVVEQGLKAGLEQHVVHLGDVYYSGTEREYHRRFLPYWPVGEAEADSVGSWSLNANHDMYSGGHGYFDVLLRDPRFARQERSSYFSLHNEDWQILGLDTGWDEGGLQEPQGPWVEETLGASGRKAILLSHHQLFSAYKPEVRATLGTKLHGVLDADRIRAWFWGHEHRCMLYRPYEHVEAARCIGHGGVPVYMWRAQDEPCPSPGTYEYRGRIVKGLQFWALFGFAVLDFDGPRLHVRYIDETGYEHHSEDLS